MGWPAVPDARALDLRPGADPGIDLGADLKLVVGRAKTSPGVVVTAVSGLEQALGLVVSVWTVNANLVLGRAETSGVVTVSALMLRLGDRGAGTCGVEWRVRGPVVCAGGIYNASASTSPLIFVFILVDIKVFISCFSQPLVVHCCLSCMTPGRFGLGVVHCFSPVPPWPGRIGSWGVR